MSKFKLNISKFEIVNDEENFDLKYCKNTKHFKLELMTRGLIKN